ncbi:MAG: DEAD/DEAH box helicase [Elusimicrobiota bacterium]
MRVGRIVNESAALYYTLKKVIENSRTSIFIIEDDIDVERYYQVAISLNALFDNKIEIMKFDLDRDNQARAIKLVYETPQRKKLIIGSEKSFKTRFPDKQMINLFILKVGDHIKRNDITEKLISAGFSKTNFVEKSGEFATRGSVVDIFNYGEEFPYRVYFDGDKIEAIRKFDIETQNTFDFSMELSVFNLKDLSRDIFSFDFDVYAYKCSTTNDDFIILQEDLCEVNENFFPNLKFFSTDSAFVEISRVIEKGFSVFVYGLNEKENAKIFESLDEKKIELKRVKFLTGYIPSGFYNDKDSIMVISSNEIFNRGYEHYYRDLRKKAKKFFRLNILEKGNFVVHEDYGVGIYKGIVDFSHKDEWGNIYQDECVEIEYAHGDKLFIPLNDFKKIQKYIGAEGGKVKISSLSSTQWKNIKEKVKKEVETIAKDIIRVEAKRRMIRLKPMLKTEFEDEFAIDFGYEETEDQKKAISDVMKDLESGLVSNRVIVGDVGFGKTEVAMRAAFRAVTNGFQVCVMCPTTILVEQHYRNFKKRFEKFGINVASISRLIPPKKQKEIFSDISKGVIDIIIGTHKLLSNNIKFKNLGVLIIDEEHKFGVKQKEEIKKRYESIHVFYLSATPIPRTLYQSLSDIRSMSIIETPPVGRLSVETKVMGYDDNVIIWAVDKEIKRGGQVYYVYNRVEFIESKLEKLTKLLPGIKIAVIHGQKTADEIEEIMLGFLEKKYDMLLASTIIESGIDIPSVNTLIVEDAHKMGLSQLYQLRGRIGREKQKAYCYLFFPKWFEKDDGNVLNTDMIKRLFALEEFSELGSGFRLAMRDLEIRGAGELLGTKQHGFINTIGLDMYVKLLNNEVARLKGKKIEEEEDVLIDVRISAIIPESYLNDDMERLNFYKRFFNARLDEIDSIAKNLCDIAGPLPKETENLIHLLKIKKIAKSKGLRKIVEKNGNIEFYFSKETKNLNNDVLRWQKIFGQRLKFFKTSMGDGFEIKILNQNRIDIIKTALEIEI